MPLMFSSVCFSAYGRSWTLKDMVWNLPSSLVTRILTERSQDCEYEWHMSECGTWWVTSGRSSGDLTPGESNSWSPALVLATRECWGELRTQNISQWDTRTWTLSTTTTTQVRFYDNFEGYLKTSLQALNLIKTGVIEHFLFLIIYVIFCEGIVPLMELHWFNIFINYYLQAHRLLCWWCLPLLILRSALIWSD